MALIRTLVQLGGGWLLTGPTALWLVLVAIVTGRKIDHPSSLYLIRTWARCCLRLDGVELDVSGAEFLAGRAPRILVLNHSSLLDLFIISSLLPDGALPVMKRELLWYGPFGLALWALGALTVDRGDRANAVAVLEAAGKRIQNEKLTVVIAPEGTRSRDGRLLPFKMGAFHLAYHSRAPVVPVVIEGAARLQPVGRFYAESGRIHVHVLPPVPSDDLTPETLHARADAVRALFSHELGAPAA